MFPMRNSSFPPRNFLPFAIENWTPAWAVTRKIVFANSTVTRDRTPAGNCEGLSRFAVTDSAVLALFRKHDEAHEDVEQEEQDAEKRDA